MVTSPTEDGLGQLVGWQDHRADVRGRIRHTCRTPPTSPLPPRSPSVYPLFQISRELSRIPVLSSETEGVGFEPTDPFGSPVFKTVQTPWNDSVLAVTCLGICLFYVGLCH
jgi:hypothetical protein